MHFNLHIDTTFKGDNDMRTPSVQNKKKYIICMGIVLLLSIVILTILKFIYKTNFPSFIANNSIPYIVTSILDVLIFAFMISGLIHALFFLTLYEDNKNLNQLRNESLLKQRTAKMNLSVNLLSPQSFYLICGFFSFVPFYLYNLYLFAKEPKRKRKQKQELNSPEIL